MLEDQMMENESDEEDSMMPNLIHESLNKTKDEIPSSGQLEREA